MHAAHTRLLQAAEVREGLQRGEAVRGVARVAERDLHTQRLLRVPGAGTSTCLLTTMQQFITVSKFKCLLCNILKCFLSILENILNVMSHFNPLLLYFSLGCYVKYYVCLFVDISLEDHIQIFTSGPPWRSPSVLQIGRILLVDCRRPEVRP